MEYDCNVELLLYEIQIFKDTSAKIYAPFLSNLFDNMDHMRISGPIKVVLKIGMRRPKCLNILESKGMV